MYYKKRLRRYYYTFRFKDKKQRLIFLYYFVLFMVVLAVTQYTLNVLGLHMTINQVIHNGIDYDAFREMKLTTEQINTVMESKNSQETDIDKTIDNSIGNSIDNSNSNSIGNPVSTPERNSVDDLTLSMMVHEFQLEDKSISNYNRNRLFQNL